MKGLSIEEKAKLYDEAIEKANSLYKAAEPMSGCNVILETIFPELKEDENEKHRKWILEYLYDGLRKSDEQFKDQFKCAIAWLEKQGEQNPADKVEPKFHEGDWVIIDGEILHITNVTEDGYSTEEGGHIPFRCEKEIRLWDITKDAKEGDMLFCKGNIKDSNGIKYERICLFNSLDNAFFILTKTSNFVEEYDIDVIIDYPDNTVPATKEQKEILFMAMADAGYTFDFEKRELKKIEQKTEEYNITGINSKNAQGKLGEMIKNLKPA